MSVSNFLLLTLKKYGGNSPLLHSKGPSAAQLLHSLHVPASTKRNPVIGLAKQCGKELAVKGIFQRDGSGRN
jgi:hypothetical protein